MCPQEDGVGNAIQAIYRDLEYAQTLSYRRSIPSSTPLSQTASPKEGAKDVHERDVDDDLDDTEWTLVDDVIDNNSKLSKIVRREGATSHAGMSSEKASSRTPSRDRGSKP